MKRNKFVHFYLLFTFLIIVNACDDVIFEEDISESFVNILGPTNNATVITGTISFNWEPVSDADNYQLQIAAPNFANAIQIVLDSTITKTSFSQQLLPNSYEWRVRAKNSAFETSYFTNALTVTEVENFKDKQVVLVSPNDNLISNQNVQTLSWQSVEGATEYRIQIWQPDINGTLLNDEVINSTNLTFTFTDNNFTWQVRGQNDTQNTLFFSRKLLIDTVKPNTPSLLTPSDNSTGSSGKISFTWDRESVAGSAETDSIYVYNNSELTNLIFKGKGQNLQFEKDLETDSYYWFVKSFDQAGNKSSNSSTFNFTLN